MKFTAKADRNQPEIVKALRGAGASVQHLHSVGAGCPDLLCAIDGKNFLIEVKDGLKDAAGQKLKPSQVDWHAAWKAPVHVVNSVEAALSVVAVHKSQEPEEIETHYKAKLAELKKERA
jgi:hypothetical protein